MVVANTRSDRKNLVETVLDTDECIPRLVRSTGQPWHREPRRTPHVIHEVR